MSATIVSRFPALTTDHDSRYRVIFAKPTKTGSQLTFYCPGCQSRHLHGRPEPGSDMTPYRESHCFNPESANYGIVYKIVEVPPNDPRLTATPRGRKPSKRQGYP